MHAGRGIVITHNDQLSRWGRVAFSGVFTAAIVAAAQLIDFERIRHTATASRADAILLVTTAFAAVFIEVEFTILIGSVVSVLWYKLRTARLQVQEQVVTPEQVARAEIASNPPSGEVLIYDFEGELFFGAAPDLERAASEAREKS